jgi:SsrA-binding protein
MAKEKGRRLIAQNRKARHDYHIHDIYEAGIVLGGTEVKSLREGRANLTDAFATVDDGEVWLRGRTSRSTATEPGPTTLRAAPASSC